MNLLAQGVNIKEKYNPPITTAGGGGTDVGSIISTLIEAAIVVAGVFLVFGIIASGFSMIQGAGSSNPETVAKGKKSLTYGIMGFTIVFTSYWIIRIIEIILGTDIVTNPLFGF